MTPVAGHHSDQQRAAIQLFRPHVSPEASAAVQEVLSSGWIGLGPRTAQFESDFAAYIGARFAVGLSSATAALHLGLLAKGVGPGDEVLTTSLTFVSTNHAIVYCGAKPVFVDVDEETLNIDLKLAAKAVTRKTKAIIAVHYGGNPLNLTELYGFAAQHGLQVLEDAAHACGASFAGKKVGSFGLTGFSFHAVKNLPTGDGGMLTTNDSEEAEALRRLRWMGIDRGTYARSAGAYQWEYEVTSFGFKCHMNDITAAMGIEHLKRLDEWNGRRAEVVAAYKAALQPKGIRFVAGTAGAKSANHLCAIRVADRDRVVDDLKRNGIGVGVHYRPNHYYKPYQELCGDIALPVTEKAYRELISLPLHLGLTDQDVSRVSDAVLEAVSGA